MAFTMIQALVGLVALASSASAFTLTAEGASSVRGLLNGNVPILLNPLDTWSYGGHGSGTGRAFITYSLPVTPVLVNNLGGVPYGSPTPFLDHGALGFADDAFLGAAPAGVTQIPIALGSITFFVNLGVALPAGVALTPANLCTIFSGQATNWNLINPAFPNLNLIVVRRVDISGSTDVIQNYLTKVCKFVVPPTTPFSVPGTIIGAGSTSNMMQTIANNVGAIGYAVCGSVDPSGIPVEIPILNAKGTAVMCQTSDYSAYTFAAPKAPLQWSDISLTNGAGVNQFPTTYILFAYARADGTKTGELKDQAYVAKRALLKLTTVAFQKTLPSYFFFPLPSAALTTVTCKAVNALKVTTPAGRTALPLITCPNCGETASASCTTPQPIP